MVFSSSSDDATWRSATPRLLLGMYVSSSCPCCPGYNTGNELFQSNKEYGLDALVAESYDDGDSTASYFGIQVVKKEQCSKIGGLSDLQGMNLCSTGYRKTAG
eukprot:1161162-Pelagomonas_calceolata.AAC.4